MPIHLAENQYRGINAHLHSYLLQESSGWQTFHTDHIGHLRSAIQRLLPAGYFVLSEKSLQIREFMPDSGSERRTYSVLDVSVFRQTAPVYPASAATLAIDPPSEVVTLIETLSDADFLNAVMILQRQADGRLIPITRLELLSPANKPPGAHYDQYLVKRDETLITGVNLVELDYLHESRPILKVLPSYPDNEPKSYPYTVLISTPHPTLEQGKTAIYGIFVDGPLPKIPVPLAGDTAIALDLQAIYNHTFAENTFYGLMAVDYAELPVNFEAYSPADQTKIQERMAKIAV